MDLVDAGEDECGAGGVGVGGPVECVGAYEDFAGVDCGEGWMAVQAVGQCGEEHGDGEAFA